MRIAKPCMWFAVCTCSLVTAPVLAQTGSNNAASQAAVSGPSYSSADSSTLPEGNSPEAEGRPGVYYFNLAADAFRKKDYTHAIEMYKVAASWAYKPAEYDLALMYYKGTGVPVDRARGAAWMVLAAERNDKSYVAARDLMTRQLSKAEFADAAQIAEELLPSYGDSVALRRAEHRWHEVQTQETGTLTGHGAGELRVGTLGGGESPLPPSRADPNHVLAVQAVNTGDILKSGSEDGAVAYRQFEESDNPYDVKFARPTSGNASVGPLQQVNKDAKDKKPEKPASATSSGDAERHHP